MSLCSGIGGIDIAAEAAGFKTVLLCERDLNCQHVLRHWWPDVPILNDVREVTAERLRELGIGRIDLLSGGIPCQPVSRAGKRRGHADERELSAETMRIIRELRPRAVLIENVKGFVDKLPELPYSALDWLAERLEAENYSWWAHLYGADAVGAPHERKRVFIVANTNEDTRIATPTGADTPRQANAQEPWQGHGPLTQPLGCCRAGGGGGKAGCGASGAVGINRGCELPGWDTPHPQPRLGAWLMGFPEDWLLPLLKR